MTLTADMRCILRIVGFLILLIPELVRSFVEFYINENSNFVKFLDYA